MKNILIIFFYILCNLHIKSQDVEIGGQYWMTKNLSVGQFNNGDKIPEVKSFDEWLWRTESRQPAWCYFESDSIYGKVYNWYCVIDSRNLCPSGYHIPSQEEWMHLRFLSPNTDSFGEKLKHEPTYKVETKFISGYYETEWITCKNCSYWTEQQKANNPCPVCKNKRGKTIKTGRYIPARKYEEKNQIGGWDGNNETGFSALPGPFINYHGWHGHGEHGSEVSTAFWSSSEKWNYQGRSEEVFAISFQGDYVDFRSLWKDSGGAYVRCLRDN